MNDRVLLLTAVLILSAVAPQADAQETDFCGGPSWSVVQRDVVDRLIDGGATLPELVAEVQTRIARAGYAAMFKVDVLTRAGISKEAVSAVAELKSICTQLSPLEVGALFHAATNQFEAWDVARTIVESYAAEIEQLPLIERLLTPLERKGWTVEEIDSWLAEMPCGRDHFWVRMRLRYNASRGRAQGVFQEFSARIRQQPSDLDFAVAVLEELLHASFLAKFEPDLSWVVTTLQPVRATDAERIASALRKLGAYASAVVFYRQALKLPATDADIGEWHPPRQQFVSMNGLRDSFAADVRDGLADCLRGNGEVAEADKWTAEADALRGKHASGVHALFDRSARDASGGHSVEVRIEEGEEDFGDDPEYWIRRALIYREQGLADLEEDALNRGLAVAPARPESHFRGKRPEDLRSTLIRHYVGLLARTGRDGDAVALLRGEIEQEPAQMNSTVTAVRVLANDYSDQLRSDDPILWRWLSGRPVWRRAEGTLLARMLNTADQADLDKHLRQVEALSQGADPSRALALARNLANFRKPDRAIMVLEDVIARAPDEKMTRSAAQALLRLYIDRSDWRHVDRLVSLAYSRTQWPSMAEWCSRAAVAAASSGDKEDALHLWKFVMRFAPTERRAVGDLAKAGLRDELRALYSDMKEALPASEIPDRVLNELSGE